MVGICVKSLGNLTSLAACSRIVPRVFRRNGEKCALCPFVARDLGDGTRPRRCWHCCIANPGYGGRTRAATPSSAAGRSGRACSRPPSTSLIPTGLSVRRFVSARPPHGFATQQRQHRVPEDYVLLADAACSVVPVVAAVRDCRSAAKPCGECIGIAGWSAANAEVRGSSRFAE